MSEHYGKTNPQKIFVERVIKQIPDKPSKSLKSASTQVEEYTELLPIEFMPTDSGSVFQAGWSNEGLVINWQELHPEPQQDEITRGPIREYLVGHDRQIAKAAGFGGLTATAAEVADTFGIIHFPDAVSSAGFCAMIGAVLYSGTRAIRTEIKENDRKRALAKNPLENQAWQQETLERAKDANHAILIENTTYGLHQRQAVELPVAFPVKTGDPIETTEILNVMWGLGTVNSQDASHTQSVFHYEGRPFLQFNPARGIAQIVAAAGESADEVITDSMNQLSDIHFAQRALPKVMEYRDRARKLPRSVPMETRTSLEERFNTGLKDLMVNFLGVGANFIAQQRDELPS